MALWIEGHAPGLPLSFLDHHIKCGDSLLGVFDLNVVGEGIPDDAYKPLTGDDRTGARDYRKRNKAERTEGALFRFSAEAEVAELSKDFAHLGAMPERSPDDISSKRARYETFTKDAERWSRLKVACDCWCAAYFTPINAATSCPTTRDVWQMLSGRALQGLLAGVVDAAAYRVRFFYWPLEFPDVFANGEGRRASGGIPLATRHSLLAHRGAFDVALGNPPWEVCSCQRGSTSSSVRPRSRRSPATSASAIARLRETDPRLWAQSQRDKQIFDATNNYLRSADRFGLTTRGKLNAYALFAELFLALIAPKGRAGFIAPTGIATDDSTKAYFDAVVSKRRLASLFDFENREKLFAAVDSRMKFCLVTLAGAAAETASLSRRRQSAPPNSLPISRQINPLRLQSRGSSV